MLSEVIHHSRMGTLYPISFARSRNAPRPSPRANPGTSSVDKFLSPGIDKSPYTYHGTNIVRFSILSYCSDNENPLCALKARRCLAATCAKRISLVNIQKASRVYATPSQTLSNVFVADKREAKGSKSRSGETLRLFLAQGMQWQIFRYREDRLRSLLHFARAPVTAQSVSQHLRL